MDEITPPPNDTPLSEEEIAKYNKDEAQEVFEEILKLSRKERALIFRKLSKSPTPRSSAYYSEKYGLQIIDDLRAMAAEGCHLFYPYEDFIWAKKTVWMYVRDAFNYCAEFLDDDKHSIMQLKEATQVVSTKQGVAIRFKNTKPQVFKARRIRPEDDKYGGEDEPEDVLEPEDDDELKYLVLKKEFQRWIETSAMKEGEKFIRENLKLTPKQVEELKEFFEPLSEFAASVKPNRLVIIKMKE